MQSVLLKSKHGVTTIQKCFQLSYCQRRFSLLSSLQFAHSAIANTPAGGKKDLVVKCPYEDTYIPDTNFYSHVFQHFPKYGKKTALIDGVTGREYSYNEVQETVVNMASGLVRSGMKKGDVLALVSPNNVEFGTTFFSTLAMGGIVSTCNPQYTAEELAYQFKDSNSKYVATIPALLPTIKEAVSKSGCIEKIIVLSDEGGLGEGKNMMSYQSLIQDSGSLFPLNVNLDYKNDIAVLPYSSGTTGLPKGVMLTHHNVTANINQLAHPQYLDFTDPNCHCIGVLPFFHIYGMIIVLASGLYQGGTSVILPKFEPEQFLQTMQKYRITMAPLVPPLILFLARHPMVNNYDLSSVNVITSGAAPLSGELATEVKEKLGIEVVRQGYGLTELSPVSHCCPKDVINPSSAGPPILNTYSKIVDLETGEDVGPDCEGEILVKGPQVMKGYLNNDEVTATTITKDGWLHTGDIGYYNAEGYFYIVDRLKELIKVKGFQVAPAELEALLLQHPNITDVAVIGVDDERSGELPRAFVVRSSDDLTEQQVEDYVKGRVTEHKQLKGGVKFIKEIPKSASGKILRRLLKHN